MRRNRFRIIRVQFLLAELIAIDNTKSVSLKDHEDEHFHQNKCIILYDKLLY